MRFGGAAGDDTSDVLSGFFIFSLGGRYYTTNQDVSPYVGGGLTRSFLDLSLPDVGFSGNGAGLGAYVDAGVEMLRTHHAHRAIGARLDAPFFSLNNTSHVSGSETYLTPAGLVFRPRRRAPTTTRRFLLRCA